MLQRSNLCFIKQIHIFLSDCVFASSGKSSVRVHFPCVHDLTRAMRSSSLWREPALQARRQNSIAAAGAGVQRYSRTRVPPKLTPPRGDTAFPSYTDSLTQVAGQTIAPTVSALCQHKRVSLQPIMKMNRRKSNKNMHMCVHTHTLPAPSTPAVLNRLTATF